MKVQMNMNKLRLLYVLLMMGMYIVSASKMCDKVLSDALLYVNQVQDDVPFGDMVYMVHGSSSTKKCKVIKDYIKRSGCKHCPAPCNTECPTEAPPGGNLELLGMDTSTCNSESPYRTFDGSCNNLEHSTWGQAGSPQVRAVNNAYDDGLGSPRVNGCNGLLPGAREVSNMLHRADTQLEEEPNLSYMVMQFGQFLAHDIILTKTFTGTDCEGLECCGKDANNAQCDPITIPDVDPHFQPGGCMSFPRSIAKQDSKGVRQQLDTHSSYLDLSQLYGTSESEVNILRTFKGGKLKTTLGKLSPDFTSNCRLNQTFDPLHFYCTDSGDKRVDVQPGLSSIHTILTLYHNRVVYGLHKVNPHWKDEKIFQEARKIMIGVWQNIVYTEYLPAILGPDVMKDYDLEIKTNGYRDTYDASVDASVINGFGTGAFRIGHTQIHRIVSMVNEQQNEIITPENLADHWFRPNLYHDQEDKGFQHILRWTASTACPFTDRKIEPSVNDFLFLDDNGVSFDLASLNIHRSRDHGNPGYNAYRSFCGLKKALHFGIGADGLVDHDPDVAQLLEDTYDCTDDIDLFPGILTEKRSPGSVVGPLGQCLIATQFKKLKDGDRYFFERQTHGFTPCQLKEIKRMTLAGILCDTTTTIAIQSNIFLKPSTNDYVSCNVIPSVNLKKWKDGRRPAMLVGRHRAITTGR